MNRVARYIAVALVTLAPISVSAQSQVSLVPGWQDPDGKRYAGVQITLEPGWKTYWRSPEGNGIPPQFDWAGSGNLADVQIHWPEPVVFTTYGVRSIGYENRVIFPVTLTPKDPSAPIDVRLGLFYGVCEEVCIPAQAGLSAAFPPAQEAGAQDVRLALASRPLTAEEAGVTDHICRIAPEGDGYSVTADVTATAALDADFAVFESGNQELWIDVQSIEPRPSGLSVRAQMAYFGDGAFALDRSAMRLTLFGRSGAIDLQGCPAS